MQYCISIHAPLLRTVPYLEPLYCRLPIHKIAVNFFRLEDMFEVGKGFFLSCERRDPKLKGALAKNLGAFVRELKSKSQHGFVLFHWLVWHAAQYCVMTKLRTLLGKAQETFLAIESEGRFSIVFS